MAASVVERFLAWLHPKGDEARLEPRAFYTLAKENPEAARRLLRAEHRALVDELETLIATVEERVGLFAERLKKSSAKTLEQDYLLLLRQREELLQLVERISFHESPTTALQEEWSEWQRYFAEVEQPEERARQRAQLVRSELAMRGLPAVELRPARVPSRVSVESDAEPLVEPKQFVPRDYDELVAKDEQGMTVEQDNLDEWVPVGEAVEGAVEFWNQQFVLLMRHPSAYQPMQAQEIVRQYRDIHGQYVEQDRMNGTRRYRVGHVVGE